MIDISALLFTVLVVALVAFALTFGVTLVVAWVLRDSLAPLLGVV